MSDYIRITPDDLQFIKTDMDIAIPLIRQYAAQYKGKEQYENLGPSCVMSATNTIDTIIGSTEYLNGAFLMPDEIHLERVVDWFLENRDYDCERDIITYYFASYIKRKINSLYRSIRQGSLPMHRSIAGNKTAKREYMKQLKKREELGVKSVR